jgi:hypothetical protein
VNARILAGAITPQAGQDYLLSFASDGAGFPPHIVADIRAWGTEMVAQSGDEARETQGDVSGPRSALISRLFGPQDRAAAAALAAALDADPRSATRTEAILHEIARTTEMDPDTSYAYTSDFARKLGVPENLVASALDAISAPAERAHEQKVMRELVGDLSPQHRAALSESERRQAREEASKFERMMRENPSEYWRPENQAAYRDALERSIAVPVPEAPAKSADGGPAAVPGTAPPATAPATPAPAPTAAAAP